jgi:hypothetical protein
MPVIASEVVEPIDREVKRSPDLTGRPETILVRYENVLKSVDLHILEVLHTPIMESMFNKIINYPIIELTNEFVLDKRFINILQDVSFDPYDNQDYDRYRRGIINRYIDFYAKCDNLILVENLKMLLRSEKVVDKIYILHPERDLRVIEDIKIIFENNPKVEPVFDSIDNFLADHTEITSIMTDRISDIGAAISASNIKWMEIMVANYKNNLKDNGDLGIDYINIMRKHICKIGIFTPFKFDEIEGEEE